MSVVHGGGSGVFSRCNSSRRNYGKSGTTRSSSYDSGEAGWGIIIGDEIHELGGRGVFQHCGGSVTCWVVIAACMLSIWLLSSRAIFLGLAIVVVHIVSSCWSAIPGRHGEKMWLYSLSTVSLVVL